MLILACVEMVWFCAAAGLRNRSLDNKALIVSEVEKNVWPAVVQGKVKPVIYKTFPLSEAAEAHKLMEESSHIGKILLIPWMCWYLVCALTIGATLNTVYLVCPLILHVDKSGRTMSENYVSQYMKKVMYSCSLNQRIIWI